jgi:hypothetical protein
MGAFEPLFTISDDVSVLSNSGWATPLRHMSKLEVCPLRMMNEDVDEALQRRLGSEIVAV